MTDSPHARARTHRATSWRPLLGALLLVVLLAGLPALSLLPASPGTVRAGGVSIEWWYGGLLAPLGGWAVAVWAVRAARDGAESAGGGAARPAASELEAEPKPEPHR